MARRNLVVALALFVLFAWTAQVAAEMNEIPMVRLKVSTQINAAPDQVWKQMTTGKNLITWCPYWKSEKNSKVTIAKVGDALDFTDDWGNGGRSIVTYLETDKEIRIAHEPNNGSYVCQARLMLEPASGGTLVTYIEQYTDESAPKDKKATSSQMETSMKETLTALKKHAEM